jgi:hypothetical protein
MVEVNAPAEVARGGRRVWKAFEAQGEVSQHKGGFPAAPFSQNGVRRSTTVQAREFREIFYLRPPTRAAPSVHFVGPPARELIATQAAQAGCAAESEENSLRLQRRGL